VTLDKHLSKNESIKRQFKNKVSRVKHQTCYTCHDKGQLSKNCPKIQTFIYKVVNDNIPHVGLNNDTSTTKVISSPYVSPQAIWVSKHLLTNH
jgi:CII-binding regulator of phage lambda lysogenization HflD